MEERKYKDRIYKLILMVIMKSIHSAPDHLRPSFLCLSLFVHFIHYCVAMVNVN